MAPILFPAIKKRIDFQSWLPLQTVLLIKQSFQRLMFFSFRRQKAVSRLDGTVKSEFSLKKNFLKKARMLYNFKKEFNGKFNGKDNPCFEWNWKKVSFEKNF